MYPLVSKVFKAAQVRRSVRASWRFCPSIDQRVDGCGRGRESFLNHIWFVLGPHPHASRVLPRLQSLLVASIRARTRPSRRLKWRLRPWCGVRLCSHHSHVSSLLPLYSSSSLISTPSLLPPLVRLLLHSCSGEVSLPPFLSPALLASCGLALAGAIHRRHPSNLHVGHCCLSAHLLNLIRAVTPLPSFLASVRVPSLAWTIPSRLESTPLFAHADSSSSPSIPGLPVDSSPLCYLLASTHHPLLTSTVMVLAHLHYWHTPVAVSLPPSHSMWFRRWGRLAGHTCLSSADCGRCGRNPGSIWEPWWRTSIARALLPWRVGPWGEGYVVIESRLEGGE
jgi:hypothetical protein